MQRGLGSFIEGAFGGYSYGEDLKDKKKQRERQKKDDEWRETTRERQSANWDRDDAWLEKVRGREETTWGRQDETYNRAEQERSVLAAIGQEAEESYAEHQKYGGETQQPDDPSANAPDGPAGSSIAADPAARKPGADHAFERGKQQYTDGYGKPSENGDPSPQGPSGGAPAGSPPVSPQQVPNGLSRTAQRPTRPTDTDTMLPAWRPSEGQDPAAILEVAKRELETGLNSQTYNPLSQQEAEQRRQYVLAAGNAAPAGNAGQGPYVGRTSPQMGGAPNTGAQAASMSPQQPVARSVMQPPAQPSAGADTPIDATPAAAVAQKDQAEAAADFQRAASTPPDKGGAPSVAIAAETAPKTKGVVKATKAQSDRASTSFLDHYAETAVPKIIQYYASQGNIEKAQAFETWAGSREARGQLESWGKAVHAATIGDDDAFLDHMSDTYNSYDDGYEVVRSESGFNRDEEGAIAGAQVTFKNTKTGETFVKTYADQADIIREGLYALAPEQVFERLWGQLAQAGDVASDQRKFERDIILEQVKAGAKAPTRNADDIAEAKKALSEQAGFGSSWSDMTPEQQTQAAVEYVKANRAAGAALAGGGAPQALPDLYLGE